MRWLRLDDGFPDHPKVCGLSPHAAWLFIRGLCYCSRFLTDGHIPAAALKRLQARRQDVSELVESGLWHAHEGDGVDVHDYLEHQPSRSKVEADRVATAQRLQAHRERKRNADVTPFQPRTADAPETSTTRLDTTQHNRGKKDPGSAGAPTGEHAELIEYFRQRFREARGEDPPWTSRDFKDLKKLREKHGLERCKGFIDRAFVDPFWRQKVTIRAIAEDPGRFVGNGMATPAAKQNALDALFERSRMLTEQELKTQ